MIAKVKALVAGIFLSLLVSACSSEEVVLSPDGRTQITFRLIDGEPFYEVSRDGQLLVSNSRLGFELKDQPALSKDLRIADIQTSSFDETWAQPWGEVKNIRNHYNQLEILLEENSDLKRQLKLTFRAYDDGLGFRYEFPDQPNLKDFVIMDELTEFNLVKNMDAWWIPAYGDEVDSEFLFTKNKLDELDQKVHTPLTMESGDSLFISIHEAALVDYAGMTLDPSGQNLKCDLVPWASGHKVEGKTPLKTPWRTIQIADKAGDLITSYLILNLNEPNKLGDSLAWIRPGKYNGIWWGMHMGKYTWTAGPDHGATTENVKRYMDFAASNNLSGVLVEGWNEGWEDWKFNFSKPYADFDIQEIT